MSSKKNEENQQRIDIEVEKLKLQAELGAYFMEGNPDLPPEVEREFLSHIRSFHQRIEEEPPQKVHDVVGRPELVPLKDLRSNDVEAALRKLRTLLAKHNISVDSLYPVASEEMYRFMTEDLMAQEVITHNVPGMMMCFTYEEFHPNHAEDVIEATTQVAKDLLQHKDFEQWYHFAKGLKFNGLYFSRRKDLNRYLSYFYEAYPSIEVQDVSVKDLEIGDDAGSAFIKVIITCRAVAEGKTKPEILKADAKFHFTNDHDWWMVEEMELPLMKK